MRIHIVQKGDILYDIANKYNVDLEELISLNPQLSSPDMIMPGMKIKIPSASKQVRTDVEKTENTAKDIRNVQRSTSEMAEMQAKTTERPMGDRMEDDHVEKKEIQAEVPKKFEPLYPVRPTGEAPKFPTYSNMEKVLSEKEKGKERLPEKVKKDEWQQEKRMEPSPHYRPMNSSQPIPSPQQTMHSIQPMRAPQPMHGMHPMQGMQQQQMYQSPRPMEETGHHCCCCCCQREHMLMQRHMHPTSPWGGRGTYYNHNQTMLRPMSDYPNK